VIRSIGALPASASESDWMTASLAGCSNDISDGVSFVTRNFRFCISLTKVVLILSIDVPETDISSLGGGGGVCEDVQPSTDKIKGALTAAHRCRNLKFIASFLPDCVSRILQSCNSAISGLERHLSFVDRGSLWEEIDFRLPSGETLPSMPGAR